MKGITLWDRRPACHKKLRRAGRDCLLHYEKTGRDCLFYDGAGFSLLELIMTLAAASLLLAGLASSVRISTRTLRNVNDTTRCDPLGAMERLHEDANVALRLTNITSNQFSLTIPDRNGDGNSETVHYRVSSNQLQRAENSNTYYPTGLTTTGLSFGTQSSSSTSITPYTDPAGRVTLKAYSSQRLASKTNQLSLALPDATTAGDLLLYAVLVQTNQTSNFAITGTWQNLANQRFGSAITMNVGYRFATASEPTSYTASWAGNMAACGYVLRFSGANSASPIASSQARSNAAAYPQAGTPNEPYLSAVTSAGNLTVVRFIGFDRDALIGSTSGLSRQVHLPLLESSGTSADVQLLGMIRQLQSTTDETTSQIFDINTSTNFVAVTVALQPAS